MHSPSGHTSLSTLVYGALALVTATDRAGLRSLLVIGAGAGLILAIEVSRLLLDAHSLPEVGLGIVIGILALALFSHEDLEVPNPKPWPLLVAAGVLMSIFHRRSCMQNNTCTRLPGTRVHCG